MLLQVPDSIDAVLWEGPLEVPDEQPHRGETMNSDLEARLPHASIGVPIVWNFADLYSPGPLPPFVTARLRQSNLYLVQLSCSFRPRDHEVSIQRARFAVQLLPDDETRRANALDLFPLDVTQEVLRDVKVTIGPSLKFVGIGLDIPIDFGFQFGKLHPNIVANGIGEDCPSWDFRPFKREMLQGSKVLFLLLEVPTQMESVRAQLGLSAMVIFRRRMFFVVSIKDKRPAQEQLTVPLI